MADTDTEKSGGACSQIGKMVVMFTLGPEVGAGGKLRLRMTSALAVAAMLVLCVFAGTFAVLYLRGSDETLSTITVGKRSTEKACVGPLGLPVGANREALEFPCWAVQGMWPTPAEFPINGTTNNTWRSDDLGARFALAPPAITHINGVPIDDTPTGSELRFLSVNPQVLDLAREPASTVPAGHTQPLVAIASFGMFAVFRTTGVEDYDLQNLQIEVAEAAGLETNVVGTGSPLVRELSSPVLVMPLRLCATIGDGETSQSQDGSCTGGEDEGGAWPAGTTFTFENGAVADIDELVCLSRGTLAATVFNGREDWVCFNNEKRTFISVTTEAFGTAMFAIGAVGIVVNVMLGRKALRGVTG